VEDAPRTREEFLAAVRALEKAHQRDDGEGSAYESTSCVRSPGTMFSEKCEDCYRCLYCTDCRRCSSCTHCVDCEGCSHCTHCEGSRGLSDCQYVAFSVDCHECSYCFGCVGLVRKDFHVLNVRYGRKEYFALVEKLRRLLGV